MDPSTLIRFHRYHTWFYRRIHLLTFILTDIGQFEEDADQGQDPGGGGGTAELERTATLSERH